MRTLALLPGFLCYALAIFGWDSIGPFGGSVAVVQVDPFHVGTVLAATRNGSIFRSTDSGAYWTAVPFPGQFRGVLHAFVVDTRVPWVYFVGLTSDDPRSAGLYRTTDEGRTWALLTGLAGAGVWSIALWPHDAGVMAVGSDAGVFTTADAGEHWRRASPVDNEALQPVVSLAFDPENPEVLYAGTPHLAWKTIDGGSTWNPIHQGMFEDSDVFSIQVSRKNPSRVLASACSGAYLSNDAGSTWERFPGAPGGSSRTYQIASYPSDPNLIFTATSHGLERSNDGGKTWKRLSDYDTRSIAFDPARKGRMYFATDDAGLLRTDDFGLSLRTIDRGFSNQRLRSMFAVDGVLYVTSLDKSGREAVTGYNGSGWQQIEFPPDDLTGPVVSISPLSAKRLVAITPTGWLTSNDFGRTWTSRTTVPAGKLIGWLPVTQDGRKVLVGTETGLYAFDEDDKSWTPSRLSPELQEIESTFRLSSVAVAVGSGSSWFLTSDALEYSPIAPPCADCPIRSITMVASRTLLAITSHGLVRSPNLGRSWSAIVGPIGNSTVTAVCAHPDKEGVAYAAAFGNVFVSNDAGVSWTLMTSGPDRTLTIADMTVMHDTTDQLFVLTHNRGVFRLSLQ